MATLNYEIGQRLKEIRKNLNLTQNQFCQTLNIDRSNYSRIERGIIPLNIPLLKSINKQLQISADWLVTGEGEKKLTESNIEVQDMAELLSIDPGLIVHLKFKIGEFHDRNSNILKEEVKNFILRFTSRKNNETIK